MPQLIVTRGMGESNALVSRGFLGIAEQVLKEISRRRRRGKKTADDIREFVITAMLKSVNSIPVSGSNNAGTQKELISEENDVTIKADSVKINYVNSTFNRIDITASKILKG